MHFNIVILTFLITFAITLLLGPILLPMLRRLKFGQFVRDDGPQSHLAKQGTPTMGGVMFLISILIVGIYFAFSDKYVAWILVVTVGFGIIGFIDDFLKIKKKQSEGLTSLQKIILQCIPTILFLINISNDIGTDIRIPFMSQTLELGYLYYPFMIIVILGTVNGVNLTDGLDGLATTVTSVIAAFFIILSGMFLLKGGMVASIVLGALLAFLIYNSYPAKVFMGDTGSLALGGFVATISIVNKMPIYIIIFGIIYLIESISVIIQVAYYKKTKKRVFKMAPFHHHMELSGYKETKIVCIFAIITIIACAISLLAII